MTPTASAAPSVRARARARRTAPTSTSPSSTATEDAVTDADRREGSRFLVPPNDSPSASRLTTTTSSPARSRSTSAAAPPRTTPPSPSTIPSRNVSAPPRPRAARTLPSARPGKSAARCSALPQRRDHGRGQHRGEERARRDLATHFVEHDDQFAEPRTRATVFLGQMDAQPAQLGHFLPERRGQLRLPPRLGLRLEQGPVGRHCAVVREHSAYGGPELLVLVVDGDRHAAPLCVGRASCASSAPGARATRPPDTTETPAHGPQRHGGTLIVVR